MLDFVNTLDNRFGARGAEELLPDYGELLRFLEQSEMLTSAHARRLARSVPKQAGRRALQSAVELREALAEVFYRKLDGRTPSASALHVLETHFRRASGKRTLAQDGAGVRWGWKTAQDEAQFPVWILAQKAADLLTSDAAGRVRGCDSPTCRWLFVDTSKNGKRRWCSMELCGNRMKARRFHEQHKKSDRAR